MDKITWQEYVSHFDEWSESMRASYVSRLSCFGSHNDVAWYANNLFNMSASSKLVNMALDAGVRFDEEDIYLMEFALNEGGQKLVKFYDPSGNLIEVRTLVNYN